MKSKVSEINKKSEQTNDKESNSRKLDGLDICTIVCLYIFLVLCILIGSGGIAICVIYFNTDENTQSWKIGGIVLSAIACIGGVILIILTLFKQKSEKSLGYETIEEVLLDTQYSYIDDDQQLVIEDLDVDEPQDNITIDKNHPHETTSLEPLHDDLIFCPGCNRLHPSAHQCLYSIRMANGFSTPFQFMSQQPQQNSISIENKSCTTIDRGLKYSITNETQTGVSTKPKSHITNSIILRRVPIPTTKVILQQPTTKILILRVPNGGGELIIQPQGTPTEIF